MGALDRSPRVIFDDSGGALAIDQDFGWIDRATVLPAFQTTREPIQDIHLYLGAPVPRAIYRWLQKLGTPQSSRVLVEEQLGSTAVMDEFDREYRNDTGQVFVSELGYGGMSDLDETVAGFGGREDLLDARQFVTLRDSLHAGFEQRRLEHVFGSMRNLYLEAQRLQAIGNRQQIEAVLVNPRVSGYVITQYNDVPTNSTPVCSTSGAIRNCLTMPPSGSTGRTSWSRTPASHPASKAKVLMSS